MVVIGVVSDMVAGQPVDNYIGGFDFNSDPPSVPALTYRKGRAAPSKWIQNNFTRAGWQLDYAIEHSCRSLLTRICGWNCSPQSAARLEFQLFSTF